MLKLHLGELRIFCCQLDIVRFRAQKQTLEVHVPEVYARYIVTVRAFDGSSVVEEVQGAALALIVWSPIIFAESTSSGPVNKGLAAFSASLILCRKDNPEYLIGVRKRIPKI